MPQILSSFLIVLGFSIFWSTQAQAQLRCEKARVIQGCIRSFADIAEEQKRVDQEDPSLKLRPNIEAIFSPVNGKQLVMNLLGRHELKIDYDETITVTYNKKVTRNAKICYTACPGEGKIQWYSEEEGAFKALPKGLQVNRYKFYIEE